MAESDREKKKISWKEFEDLVKNLAEKIKGSRNKFDSIICINRGGLVMGRILSDALGLPLGVISATYYRKKTQDAKDFLIDDNISISEDIGQNILVVDDLIGTGRTMKSVVEFLRSEYPDNDIKTAVLLNRVEFDGKNIVDFFVNYDEHWIVFPYEIIEFNS